MRRVKDEAGWSPNDREVVECVKRSNAISPGIAPFPAALDGLVEERVRETVPSDVTPINLGAGAFPPNAKWHPTCQIIAGPRVTLSFHDLSMILVGRKSADQSLNALLIAATAPGFAAP
jgi:hypothetical protein